MNKTMLSKHLIQRLYSKMILNINIEFIHFEDLVSQICPPELQLNKVNASNTKTFFFIYLHLSISNGSFSSTIMLIATSLISISKLASFGW